MRERYEIGTIEQLRAISDMLRIRIIDLLEKRPMTVTQLGEQLGLAPAKVHYHVRELERVGLLELVETREKGGILEKYYQPIAHEIGVNNALLSAPSDEAQAALRELFDQISNGYLQAFRQVAAQPESLLDAGMGLGIAHIYLTAAEQNELSKQFQAILKPFEEPRGIEGERAIAFSVLTYPTALSAQEQKEELSSSKVSRVWVIGALSYTRNELLTVREKGKRLRITVIGVCHFNNDISASLVEETIESFKLVGQLIASSAVSQVLRQKGK